MESNTDSLLTKIANVAPVGLHEVRRAPDGTISLTRAAHDISDIYGYSAKELISDFSVIWTLIHPDDHERLLAALAVSAQNLTPYECEWRIQHPVRGEIWVECHAGPERLEDGTTVWYGYFHDITETRRAQQSHKETRRSLSILMDNLPGMVYRCANSIDWPMDFVSSGVISLTGYTPGQFFRSEVMYGDLIHPKDRDRVWNEIQAALLKRSRFQLEYRLIDAKGEEKWVWEQGAGVFDDQDQIVALEGFICDISEQKQAAERLAILNFALNQVQEAAFLINEQAGFLYVNDEACHSLGYSREELLALKVTDINEAFVANAPADSCESWQHHWQELREQGSVNYESYHEPRTGNKFPVEIIGNYFEYEGQGFKLTLARDITQRKQQEKEVEYRAYHDPLTNLPNRALVMNRLEQSLAAAQRHDRVLAILFVDLDRFKTINDTLGHSAGDLLLQQVGKRLTAAVRKDDTVGRLGGDEFLILVSDLNSAEDSSHVVEKLQAALEQPFEVAEQRLHVTASIGISLFPRDANAGETLVRYADNALYLAKEEGRNTFRYFSPELDARIHDRLLMENELRQAIQRDELFLHYQPQVCLASGRITGVEALARWRNGILGLVPPDKFIPIAEDVGLIMAIGEWVLRRACMDAHRWHSNGLTDVRISVNLSQRQIEQPDFTDRVAQILVETGCDPLLLEFEITESMLMAHPEQAIAKLNILHAMGIKLSLDDFGTGYSSLSYLKRLPLDRLKIDKSFVNGIPNENHDVAIVQATIVLARQLGLTVVAEGVEELAQKEFLIANGCAEMQGYLLSRPVPADALEKFLGVEE